MTRAHDTRQSLFLTGLLVLTVAVGTVAAAGVVSAQDTSNETENGTTTANEAMSNQTMPNETDENVSLVAEPSGANVSANHTVSAVVLGENATGNLSEITINYGESNVSFGLVSDNIHSVTAGGEDITANATAAEFGPNNHNLTIRFDDTITVTDGDQIGMVYGGVTNPIQPGNYTVGIAINNGSFSNTTLEITEADESMSTTTAGIATTTDGMMTTEGATDTTEGDTGTTVGNDKTSANATNGSAGEGTTSGNGPGFTLIVGVVALFATALVATHRD